MTNQALATPPIALLGSQEVESDPNSVAVRIIDCDVHPNLQSDDEYRSYLDEPWRSRRLPDYNRAMTNPGAGRDDAMPPNGGPPASDPDLASRQLFGDAGVDIAILIPLNRFSAGFEPGGYGETAASCSAYNRWQADTWLSKYNAQGRFRGSILIPIDDPVAAVKEIETWAGHPHFVQALISEWAPAGLGHRQFDPIWEALSRHGLPITLHVTGSRPVSDLRTPVGMIRDYAQNKSATFPICWAQHLVSMVFGGAFDRFDGLKLALVEGGVSWAYPVMQRMDRIWRTLPREASQTGRLPSETIRERVRWTTQPIEEPNNARHLAIMYELMGAKDLVMFSTDYPHSDFDNPSRALAGLPLDWLPNILVRNAADFYGLPTTLPRAAAA